MASKTQASMLLLLPFLLLSHLSSSIGCPVVTYWGQNGNEGELNEACDTGLYEIINIAFINKFGNFITPELDITGHGIWWPERDLTQYGPQIAYCQSKGIKIFISLGGDAPSYTLTSEDDAKHLAQYLWNYYLSGDTSYQSPMGHVTLDGVDFDIEGGGTNLYYDDLLKELHKHSQHKKFLLSAAPQCPIPDYYLDTSIKTGLFDYIWVQFYNNPPCQYNNNDGDTQKLIDSWTSWTNTYTATKFFLGLPASPAATGSAGGYVPIDVLNNRILPQVQNFPRYGGVMLWSRYYDKLSGYSDQIECNAYEVSKVASESKVGMMKSATNVMYNLLSRY